MWTDSLIQSIATVEKLIADKPINYDELEEAFENLQTDVDQVETFRPVSNKALSYSFQLALADLVKARRLQPKVTRLLRLNGKQVNPDPVLQQDFAQRKVPELPIKKFDGKYAEYNTFLQTFNMKYEKLILPPAHLLCHLEENLSGEPALIISKLEPTDANYAYALTTLETKYNNKGHFRVVPRDQLRSFRNRHAGEFT